jgi:hypothetical protein
MISLLEILRMNKGKIPLEHMPGDRGTYYFRWQFEYNDHKYLIGVPQNDGKTEIYPVIGGNEAMTNLENFLKMLGISEYDFDVVMHGGGIEIATKCLEFPKD